DARFPQIQTNLNQQARLAAEQERLETENNRRKELLENRLWQENATTQEHLKRTQLYEALKAGADHISEGLSYVHYDDGPHQQNWTPDNDYRMASPWDRKNHKTGSEKRNIDQIRYAEEFSITFRRPVTRHVVRPYYEVLHQRSSILYIVNQWGAVCSRNIPNFLWTEDQEHLQRFVASSLSLFAFVDVETQILAAREVHGWRSE
ncbi:MAG TPA: hypothetical protein VIK81_04200, partial [Patescibacteria group bacterium]